MFAALKNKFYGKMLFSVDLEVRKPTSVFLWERDGKRTLNIKSKNFFYVQSSFGSHATVWVDCDEIGQLSAALASVSAFNERLEVQDK
ncbi:hypothetical protein ABID16_001058 [Rhizobium aquaticum]|uniref:Uncharacterized protein n=1 Tax=Rhizobium aquaticum TaxID=1549636 RepID=A0ABV2IWM4_9HYPH